MGRRADSAWKATRGAAFWATLVMGAAFPLVLCEMMNPLAVAAGRTWPPALMAAGAFCAAMWFIWVGCAALAGWVFPKEERRRTASAQAHAGPARPEGQDQSVRPAAPP